MNPHLQSAIRNFALLFFGCLAFHLAGTWSLPLIDRDEPRFAEASREMRARGDYVVPYFNNQYRFDKPPLTYWFQVASYRAFGENDFAARLPSAVAAALTALVLLAWGTRVRDARTGWWAAVIFTLCLQTFMHGKAAVADMWLVLFVTLAHWAGHELLRREPAREARGWWLLFYLALACAFLAKGPIGWTPLAAIGAMKLFVRPLELNRRFHFALGLLLTLTLVALWGVPALIRTHGEFLRIGIGKHVIARSVGTMEGHGAKTFGAYLLLLPFYFVTVWISFFPWSMKLPWLAQRLRTRRDQTDCYLLAGTAIIFAIFTLVKTKLPHYTLPAFPLLALLLARNWFADGGNSARPLRLMSGITAVCCLALALFAFPIAARWFPAPVLFAQARASLRPEMEFASIEFNEPSLVWYFRSRIQGWAAPPLNPKRIPAFMEKAGARFCVLPAALAREIYPTIPPAWQQFSARGINVAKGERVDLSLLLKPE